jgi:hypothetical protein
MMYCPDYEFPTEVELNGEPVEIWVHVNDVVWPQRGNRRGHPDTWEPDEGGEFSLAFAWWKFGNPSDMLEGVISKPDYDRIESEVFPFLRRQLGE